MGSARGKDDVAMSKTTKTATHDTTVSPVRRLGRLLTTGALAAGMLIVPIAGEAAAKPAPQAKIMCGFCVK